MKEHRTYNMESRAVAAAETREQILAAMLALATQRPLREISLEDVATEAKVSSQTVLRHFGDRGGLIRATVSYGEAQVVKERWSPPGDVPAAIATVMDHYERWGRPVLLLLSQEASDDIVKVITEGGKRVHLAWVKRAFGPIVASRPDKRTLVDLLAVATDVYVWKLLRLDRAMSRRQTEQRMLRMVRSLLASEEG